MKPKLYCLNCVKFVKKKDVLKLVDSKGNVVDYFCGLCKDQRLVWR